MIDLADIATNLKADKNGIWFSRGTTEVSYPEEGHSECHAIEQDSFWFAHRNRCILEVMKRFPPGGTVFDVGGGNGHVSAALAAAGQDTVLVEPGMEGVLNARSRGVSPLVCATLDDAGFKPHSIPAIGIFDVLEHMPDEAGFLHSLKTHLAPGGRLYVTVPAYRWLWSVEDTCSGHHRRYSLGGLTSVLQAAGFQVEYQSSMFSCLPLPIFLFRTIPSWLRLRTARQFERNQREHKNGGGGWLSGLLAGELKKIAAGRTVRFGGSCLVVARYAPDGPSG